MQIENGSMSSRGTSFITGEDDKFTVFLTGTREESGYTADTVEVFSGEVTSTGIINFQWAVFMVDNHGDPLDHWLAKGRGYFKKDSDGFSEKIQKQEIQRQVIIDMADSAGNGWDHNAALEIIVNEKNVPSARLNIGSFERYTFCVSPGDAVNIYWTGNRGIHHGEDSFIMYNADTPPVPVFNTTSWSGSNALLFRLQNTISDADLDQLLGSFNVPSTWTSPSIQIQNRNTLYSKGLLH
jgi:hypothetical protein